MKSIVLTLLFFSYVLTGLACLNEIGTIDGIHKMRLEPYSISKPLVEKAVLLRYIEKAEKSCGSETCSDLVIAYLYAGEYAKALELSTRLAAKFPRKYEIVMTHAAALELNGQFSEALTFLKKGVEINPSSHKKSEWIHIKILENRIQKNGASILGLDFGSGEYPVAPPGINLRKTLEQLQFQLMERYYFIPKKDEQFGALLWDYANLLYLNNFKTAAKNYYELAIDYGYKKIAPNGSGALLDTVQTHLDTVQVHSDTVLKAAAIKNRPKEHGSGKKSMRPVISIAVVIAIILVVMIRIRRKRS